MRLFKILAFAEAVTWSLLIAGLIARATVGIPAELFTLVGGTHGLVFLSYGVMAALVALEVTTFGGIFDTFASRYGGWAGAVTTIMDFEDSVAAVDADSE
jgi:hypothetical protein